MKITVHKKRLNEIKTKREIYEVYYRMTISQDANFEQIKTDIRAIKGVSIVSAKTGSRKEFETFEKITYRIKFVPYGTPTKEFTYNLETSFRKLRPYGLMSFTRIGMPQLLEK
tara:strand:- start:178 stop:516 length:339 start_codon:yes stop_codon:yes gene_type:complete